MKDSGTVWVRRQWWQRDQRALYPLESLQRVHWTAIDGGMRRLAPWSYPHALIRCEEKALKGSVPHWGAHESCPHEILIGIVARDNSLSVMRSILELAGEKPVRSEIDLALAAVVAVRSAGQEGLTYGEIRRAVNGGERMMNNASTFKRYLLLHGIIRENLQGRRVFRPVPSSIFLRRRPLS